MPGDIGRYQLDYILVRQRFRNQIKDCRSYAGADIDSDHNLVVMKANLKFKILKKRTYRKKYDVDKLKSLETRNKFGKSSDNMIEKTSLTKDRNIEVEWSAIKGGLLQTAGAVLGYKKNQGRKPWITNEILTLIEERRKFKTRLDVEGQNKYKALKWQIIRKCRIAKEKWIEDRCGSVEAKLKVGKTDEAYTIIKRNFREIAKNGRNIRNSAGNILITESDRADRWQEYLGALYAGSDVSDLEEEVKVEMDNLGCSILREEFDSALRNMKNGKAPGIDGLQAELLKWAGPKVKDYLFRLVSHIYETGIVPNDYKHNIILAIPKKRGSDRCQDFRTISLTTHASKILTRIVHRRMEGAIEEALGEDQFGFRRNKGTREAVLGLRLITEKVIAREKKLYIGFVDLEKAFDNIRWEKLFEILKKAGITYRDRRVIHALYKEQQAVMEFDQQQKFVQIRKGVRQGCTLSPLIFNLYIEDAINMLKDKIEFGINIQGKNISMLRFADDIAVLANSESELEIALNEMETVLAQGYGMKINKSKTEILVCSKKEKRTKINIKLGGDKLKEVANFCYLGSQITQDGRSCRDIKQRLAQGRIAFNKKRSLLCSKNINLAARKRLLKAYVWSVALYGCETWTIGSADRKKIEAFEMWCYRRMLRIPWVDKVTNEEVLNRVGEERSIWRTIKMRRDRMVGHILRHEGLVRHIMESEVGVKRGRGRPRLDYCSQIIRDVGCSSFGEMHRLAQCRKQWRWTSNQSPD